MKSRALFVTVPTVSWVSLACNPPPPICTKFCDRLYYAEESYAEETCGGLRSDQQDAERVCRDACHEAWDDTTTEEKDDVDSCINCILDEVPKEPNWDEVDKAINGDCRKKCIEGETFNDAWAYFYMDFHTGLKFENEPCPPKFTPATDMDAGVLPDAGMGTDVQ